MFKGLTIRTLQIVSGVFATIAMSALVFFNYMQLDITDKNIDHQEILVSAVMDIKDARYYTIQIQQFLTDVGATSDEGGYQEAKNNLSKALISLDRVKKLKPELSADIDVLKKQIIQVHAVGVEMAQAYLSKGQVAGNAIMKRSSDGLDDASISLANKLEKVSQGLYQELNQATINSQTAVHTAENMVLWLTLIIMAVLGLITLIFYFRIIPPLYNLRNSMLDVSEGSRDLTVQFDVPGRCEIGQVAAGFNLFVKNVRSLISEIAKNSAYIAERGDKMSLLSSQTMLQMDSLQTETQAVSIAIDEMNATVQEVATSADQAAEEVHQANDEAQNGRRVVEQTIASIHHLADKVEYAGSKINDLQQDVESIGSIIGVISAISEQTNLLALNAAIEAARAGEQGRGFAVVADEVRILAQRTQESTIEIQQTIEQLQHRAKDAVIAMQEGQEQTLENVEQAKQAGDSLEKITSTMSTIDKMVDHISSAVSSQSVVAEDISRNTQNITIESQKTLSNAQNIEDASAELGQLLEKLNTEISKFNVGHTAGLDLSKAKTAHLAWKTRLRAFLDGTATLSEEQAVSHHHCDFGKWYYSEGLSEYGHIQALRDVENPHAKLHQMIKDIVQLKKTGKTSEAEVIYQQVEPLSDSIINLLNKVERDASSKENAA